MLGWFLLTIAFIWILGATVTDLKKREVPDWLSIALVARMIYSLLEKDISFFLQGALFFAIFFALANLFYYARIFAGGDAKLLMGLGAILAAPPVLPFSQGTSAVISIPMPFVFILNLLIVGSLYGLLFTTVVAIKNRKRFFPEFVKKCGKVRIFFLPVAALVIVVAILTIFTKSYFLLPFAVLALLFPFIHSAIKALEEVGMVSLVHPKDLALGDWLAREVRAGGKVVKPTWEGLSKKELEFLQRAKKKVLVKYGIPFVPAFLLTLLATILLGNLFEFLIRIIMPFS